MIDVSFSPVQERKEGGSSHLSIPAALLVLNRPALSLELTVTIAMSRAPFEYVGVAEGFVTELTELRDAVFIVRRLRVSLQRTTCTCVIYAPQLSKKLP